MRVVAFIFAFLVLQPEFRLRLNVQQFEHKHPETLPTDPETWQSCCHDYDCVEALVTVGIIDDEWARVGIANFPLIRVKRDKIYPSKNGKSYFCTAARSLPPTEENILCVFVAKPSYV